MPKRLHLIRRCAVAMTYDRYCRLTRFAIGGSLNVGEALSVLFGNFDPDNVGCRLRLFNGELEARHL